MGRRAEVESRSPVERLDEVAAGLACKVGRVRGVALRHCLESESTGLADRLVIHMREGKELRTKPGFLV